jgi:Domain of unknown function (DUF4262)
MTSTTDQIEQNIAKYGWQFQFVFDNEGEHPPFAYSIGFEESYNHPEIMIFGLKREIMHSMLSHVASEIKGGKVYELDKKTKNVFSGDYDVMFKNLNESYHPEYAGIAMDYYNKPIRIYVMLWPDKNNVLPTESNCQLTVQNEALGMI